MLLLQIRIFLVPVSCWCSSDPEGPAQILFQEPYFKLLADALRDGGVITTQGIFPFDSVDA